MIVAEKVSFAPDAVFRRIRDRVAPDLAVGALDPLVVPPFGDQTLNEGWAISADRLAAARTAAVLVPLVERDGAVQVLLTQRTAALRQHAGQIAFPGGKMDPGDATPAATALRETTEEIGLPADRVEVLGYLGGYLTRTGFRIIPVVARLHPPFTVRLNAAEVVESFEVPFAWLMSDANHLLRSREWDGAPRYFYAMEHGGRTIWGITAGILRVLYERLYA
jgi:8-oxo-dGTP pyrophosphatase MutT (NUDIX family)